MEASWRQPTTLKGLSRFLVEHEPCGAGFDVSHPAGLGSGRVSMTCRGCGATYEYATATIEFEREVEFEPVRVPTDAEATATKAPAPRFVAQPPPVAIEAAAAEELDDGVDPPRKGETAGKDSRPDDGESHPQKDGGKGWTRDRLITAGLLVFAAAALAFAVIRISGDSESSNPSEPAPPVATTPTQPAKTTPASPKPAHTAPTPQSKPKPKQPQASPAKPAANEQVVKTDRFSVTVPDDWTQRAASGGGTLLAPPGSAPVSLQIFYENDPGLPEQQMSAQSARFLRSRDPAASVSPGKNVRIAGNPAFELRATGPAGTQTALGVLADPYRYLVLLSADPGTPKATIEAAERALASFRPR